MFKAMFEEISPTSAFIRKDVRSRFISEFNIPDEKDLVLLDNIINKRIPDDIYHCEFSWRGYLSFEINKSIAHSLRPEFNALKILKKYLTPVIIHRLYRYPDGLRYKALKNRFEYEAFKADCEMKL